MLKKKSYGDPCSDCQIHPLKSRITARQRANPGQSLQRFPSLPPEIRNHCSRGVVAFCRWNHSPSRQRRMESDADLVVATTTAGGTILLCCNKIRIGRGPRFRHGRCRRNHSPLQRRLPSIFRRSIAQKTGPCTGPLPIRIVAPGVSVSLLAESLCQRVRNHRDSPGR